MAHILHQFRETQPGEGESRVNLADMPGDDWAVVEYEDYRGWVAKVYRAPFEGVYAARAWGEPHKLRRDAMAEVRSSGIPFMVGHRQ